MKRISILIPAYNEQEVLSALYERLIKLAQTISGYELEFMFVNDGSSDDTLEIIKGFAGKDKKISYVSLSRNFGKEIAMLAGMDHLKESDAVIIIDADLQDPPELIPEMISYWEEGYDDVYAKRRSRAGESWFKKITSRAFYKILQKSTRVSIQRDTGDFRLLSQRCISALTSMREAQRYTKGMFSWVGYKKKEILYDRDPRAAGNTKWNYWRLMDLAIEGITSFTVAPLRIASFVGIAVSILAFMYGLYILIRPLFGAPIGSGYSSMMVAVLFLGGIQLIAIGVIGEYIGRIFNETKRRPPYFVDEYYTHHKKKR